ncbi:MAG TPA: NAD(P)H-binding protein [Terriglobia bacterium]|nr:NAD(P)H-binding protein [Terriglobia bacterium]
MKRVFITGGTGYMGRNLISTLMERGHQLRALVRPGSEGKLPPGCPLVFGDALDAPTYAPQVPPADTIIQLVGYPKPDPRKAAQFREVDLKSGLAAVVAAREARIEHLVYVSVAHPAPIMQAYIQPRVEVEEAIRASGLNATILRPWYVLGPGHRWPYALLPAYWLMALIPGRCETARRLGLVTLGQMVNALVAAVENPCHGVRVVEVSDIRQPHRWATPSDNPSGG